MSEHETLKGLRIRFLAAVNRKDIQELGFIKKSVMDLGTATDSMGLKKTCSEIYARIQVMSKELGREI